MSKIIGWRTIIEFDGGDAEGKQYAQELADRIRDREGFIADVEPIYDWCTCNATHTCEGHRA